MTRAKPLPRSIVVIGVGLPLVALVALLVGRLGADDDGPAATEAYAASAADAFEIITPALLDVATTAGAWATGDASDESLIGALDALQALLPRARSGVAALDEPGEAAPARRLHLAALDLYAVAVDAHRAALAADGTERTESDLLARRVRTLADRIYDQARAIVDPRAADPVGVTVIRSTPVPSWVAEGLAAEGSAGADLDEEAAAQDDDAPGRRAALRLLVLADAERAAALDLDPIAEALRAIADDMS